MPNASYKVIRWTESRLSLRSSSSSSIAYRALGSFVDEIFFFFFGILLHKYTVDIVYMYTCACTHTHTLVCDWYTLQISKASGEYISSISSSVFLARAPGSLFSLSSGSRSLSLSLSLFHTYIYSFIYF